MLSDTTPFPVLEFMVLIYSAILLKTHKSNKLEVTGIWLLLIGSLIRTLCGPEVGRWLEAVGVPVWRLSLHTVSFLPKKARLPLYLLHALYLHVLCALSHSSLLGLTSRQAWGLRATPLVLLWMYCACCSERAGKVQCEKLSHCTPFLAPLKPFVWITVSCVVSNWLSFPADSLVMAEAPLQDTSCSQGQEFFV